MPGGEGSATVSTALAARQNLPPEVASQLCFRRGQGVKVRRIEPEVGGKSWGTSIDHKEGKEGRPAKAPSKRKNNKFTAQRLKPPAGKETKIRHFLASPRRAGRFDGNPPTPQAPHPGWKGHPSPRPEGGKSLFDTWAAIWKRKSCPGTFFHERTYPWQGNSA